MSDTDQAPGADEPFDLERAPLDEPPTGETDWGGDGSDLTRPVRAHVLAALRPSAGPYQPPLDALLSAGPVDIDKLDLAIGQEHLPELLRMARDRALHTARGATSEVLAPGHALELISRLDFYSSVAELTPLFDLDSEDYGEALTSILPKAGGPAIEPLQAYLTDRTRWVWGRMRAVDTLTELALSNPELAEQVVTILSGIVAGAADDAKKVISAAVAGLLELDVPEALPQIRRAFELDKVDEMIVGPWGEVQAELGEEPDDDDPLVELSAQRFEVLRGQMLQQMGPIAGALPRPRPAPLPARAPDTKRKQEARKAKNKRKQEKASRKANRKKRK